MLLRLAMLLVVGAVLAAGAAAVGEDRIGRRDHEQARRAFERGEIRSLSDILAGVRAQFDGEIIEVELQRKGGAYRYEFKLLAPGGRIREVEVDAANGRVIKSE